MLCTVRLEKLQLEHTDFFLQRGVLRTQMGILHPHVTHAIRRPNTSWTLSVCVWADELEVRPQTCPKCVLFANILSPEIAGELIS